ncbi:MAG: cytidylate kinase-like family protein [Verrucomicrobiota bacterium]
MSTNSHGWAMASLEARITAHVHAWEKAKERGQPLAPETYPFVTISREFGCEGSLLAYRLQEILNERCRPFFPWVAYDHQLLDKVARELHLSRGVVEAIDGRRRNEMSAIFDSILNNRVEESVIVRKMAEVIRSLAIHGHTITVGRGSHLITQDLRNGMHVRLVAPRGWRVHQAAADRGLTVHEAEQFIDQGERERRQYLKTFFVEDAAHPFHHDLIIDNSRFNLAQIAEIVFTALSARFGETLVGA